MDKAGVVDALGRTSPEAFLDTTIFDCVPHVFSADRTAFVQWKRTLARGLEVDPACITLVGSAAVGCSLNPVKNFREFGDDSDIDVAVISNYHFTVAWRYFRNNNDRRMRVDPRTRIAWDEHVTRYVYWGTIATDRLLGILPFGLAWLRAKTEMSTVPPTVGREINLRIYADYESLRAYQLVSARSARNSLFKETA